jgi:hypothetical protein
MKDRKMNGLNPTRDGATNFDSVINMSNANYEKCTSAHFFKYGDDGKSCLKTAEEIAEYDSLVSKSQIKAKAKEDRNDALMACTVELNGSVYQTRPSDEANFRLSIYGMAAGDIEGWILEDDTVKDTSKEDLTIILGLGLEKVKAIYKTYKDILKAL